MTIDDHVAAIPRVAAVMYKMDDDRRMAIQRYVRIITIFATFRTIERGDFYSSDVGGPCFIIDSK